MRYASSALKRWSPSLSSSAKTATVFFPISFAARIMRIAISPRLAIRIFLKSAMISPYVLLYFFLSKWRWPNVISMMLQCRMIGCQSKPFPKGPLIPIRSFMGALLQVLKIVSAQSFRKIAREFVASCNESLHSVPQIHQHRSESHHANPNPTGHKFTA